MTAIISRFRSTVEAGRRHLERVVLLERGLADLVFLDIEQRAEIVADALALFDADGILGLLGHSAIGAVDDHPQHRTYRFTAQLDVEDFESVAARHASG